MRLTKLTKAQINEAIDSRPIHELLNVDKRALTTKQLKYCENLARGDTKAGAYRKAYNSKGNSRTVAKRGHEMSKRGDIQGITEAIKLAIEFERSYSAGQVRALVAHRLTVEAIAEDSNPSVRVNALKALAQSRVWIHSYIDQRLRSSKIVIKRRMICSLCLRPR